MRLDDGFEYDRDMTSAVKCTAGLCQREDRFGGSAGRNAF